MHNFPRPESPTVSVEKNKVDAQCPQCDATDIASYRVLSEGGWWQVVKCQSCLYSISREPGPLLGAITPLGMEL